jgi:hypothetical protein
MKYNYLNQLFSEDGKDYEDIFSEFDFNLFNDNDFKEDAVREEIIYPLLKLLGYSASNENKVIRSKTLKHPFYFFGTKKYNVNIIPDYVFEIENEIKWILDAKRPTENIDEGKNVFQAYSYAMHPEIQSEIYGLCNGKKIVIFNIKKHIPILSFEIKDLKKNWNSLKNILSPELIKKPQLKNFHLDLGLFLLKIGEFEGVHTPIDFPLKKVNDITKLDENNYCINSIFGITDFEGKTFMGTFDFSEKLYQELLQLLPKEEKIKIETNLKKQPFRFRMEDVPAVDLTISALIGQQIRSNENESYLTFDVLGFKK